VVAAAVRFEEMDSSSKTVDASEARHRRETLFFPISQPTEQKPKPKKTKPFHISVLFALFGIFLFSVVLMFLSFPSLDSDQRAVLYRWPRNFSEIRAMGEVLSLYTEEYYYTVLVGFGFFYLFLQTFSIPGSIFLSFLAGALFGLPIGVLLVCTVATMGATLSYFISFYIIRKLVKRIFPSKLELWRSGEQAPNKPAELHFVLAGHAGAAQLVHQPGLAHLRRARPHLYAGHLFRRGPRDVYYCEGWPHPAGDRVSQ